MSPAPALLAVLLLVPTLAAAQDDWEDEVPLTLNESVYVSDHPTGEVRSFGFDGKAGQRVRISLVGPHYRDTNWKAGLSLEGVRTVEPEDIEDASGKFELPEDGHYVFRVTAQDTNSYSIELKDLSGPVFTLLVGGGLSSINEVTDFAFSGTVGMGFSFVDMVASANYGPDRPFFSGFIGPGLRLGRQDDDPGFLRVSGGLGYVSDTGEDAPSYSGFGPAVRLDALIPASWLFDSSGHDGLFGMGAFLEAQVHPSFNQLLFGLGFGF